jgi:L-ascorbate metabolism protein UlaG (beta-lactamase superfamily)
LACSRLLGLLGPVWFGALRRFAILALALAPLACGRFGRILTRNAESLVHAPARLPHRITQPVRPEARLAVLWVGHATALVQIDDKLILTDPVFTETVGQLSRRLVEPGIDPANLPRVDAAVISHLHFDHLSLGSLAMIEKKLGFLAVPEKGTLYVPDYAFETVELRTWQSFERGGLRLTAVPVRHSGFRWGVDAEWMDTGYTGWVIEYHGLTVYFGGDTAYTKERFRATAARFPHIDLALLPIAPINPREIMESRHVDPREALWAFRDLGAQVMIPVHHATFVNSSDPPDLAVHVLREEMRAQGVPEDRVRILGIGEQAVLLGR